jgi:hypothetical protein
MKWFTTSVNQKLENPGNNFEVVADVLGEWIDRTGPFALRAGDDL